MGSEYESSDGEKEEADEELKQQIEEDAEYENYVEMTSEQIVDKYGPPEGEYGNESIADNETIEQPNIPDD